VPLLYISLQIVKSAFGAAGSGGMAIKIFAPSTECEALLNTKVKIALRRKFRPFLLQAEENFVIKRK